MTVIDFHNHLGVDLGAELSQTADELLARMEEARIDRARGTETIVPQGGVVWVFALKR